MSSLGFDHIPERRENWAEAEFKGGAKSVVTLRDGHVMIADEPPEEFSKLVADDIATYSKIVKAAGIKVD